MRITTIVTADQREAISQAGIACRLIAERFNGGAALAEIASENNLDYGFTQWQLLNVWGPGEDHGTAYNTREHLWCNDAEQGPNHGLTADDVARIQTIIQHAGGLDPNIFGICDLADGVFDLDITKVLEMVGDDEKAKLVFLIEELGITEIDLDDLVETAACPPNGEPAEVPDEVTNGGIAEQAAFLIQRLGFDEAAAAVKIHRAA